MKSYADSPWSNSKGSDTTMLNQWLHWVASLHLVSPTAESQPYERLLRLFKHTVEQSFAMLEICYSHGLWLTRCCAKHLYGRIFLLLRGYKSLATEVLKSQFNAFGLKPKMHALHHVEMKYVCNCWLATSGYWTLCVGEMSKTRTPLVAYPGLRERCRFGPSPNESCIDISWRKEQWWNANLPKKRTGEKRWKRGSRDGCWSRVFNCYSCIHPPANFTRPRELWFWICNGHSCRTNVACKGSESLRFSTKSAHMVAQVVSWFGNHTSPRPETRW